MIKLFRKIKILSNISGFCFLYLLLPFILGFYKAVLYLFKAIDFIFYHKKQSSTKIDKPIFLIGHPRSGTTFIHRFLLDNNPQLKGNFLWEMIYSSISLRKFIRPFLPKMNKIFIKRNAYNKAIHETGLLQAETDDAAIMFRFFEGLLPFLYFDAWKKYKSEEDLLDALKKNVGVRKHQKYLMNFYLGNMQNSNKRLFGKMFSGILFIDDLIKDYPDSKILLVVRKPEEVIPSSLSLVKSMLSSFIDFNQIDENKKQLFYKNIVTVSRYYYSLLNSIVQNLNYKSNILAISYESLKTDFSLSMKSVYEFCDLELNEQTIESLEKQAEKQKQHKSKHQYSLEEFGLDKTIIGQMSSTFLYK